jgi:pyruvate dehydrogenase E1 component alpha subunit/2-oxoisovalerate dehydrogenase E1 component alpha subunit
MSEADTVDPLPYSPSEVAQVFGERWNETLVKAYHWMVLGRAFDARMQALQRQGRIGFYGAATGQEAVNVSAGLVSRAEDWVFPGLREQLVAVVRGFPLVDYAHSIFGDARDPARGRQMPCHPTARRVHYVSMSSVIGTQISQAVGLAYALRLRRDPGVSLAFFGDGATSSNDFHAGLNLAGVLQLPVVFVCANNQWAISVPVERQTASTTLASKAAAYGIPGRRLDGTDFVAVYRELGVALRDARSGNGPTMLELLTYRMTPHSSSDDPTRYQPADWARRAVRLDPVARLERWMTEHGALPERLRSRLRSDAEEAARAAVRVAEETPPPGPDTLTEDVYSSVPSRGAPEAG